MRRPTVLTWLAGLAGLGLLVAALLIAPVVWLALDDTAVPAASDAPDLPDGVTVAEDEVLCASGGCWRQLTLTGRAASDLTGIASESCAARSLIDRRVVCTWLDFVDGEARLSLRFDRPG